MGDESDGDDWDLEVDPDPLDGELDSDLDDLDLDLDSDEEAMLAATLETIENDEKNIQQSVMFGSVVNIPKEQKNVIRIFISSTFTDMKVERNVLMSSVFPKLKSYCKETHNLEFQVVDMRWGVQDQASDDHSTSELCLREIVNCQRESAGPNFVCLVGDRYGTRYLKKYIPEEQWIILISRIKSTEVKKLLDIWYKLDTNSKIPQRILQPISSVVSGADQWESSESAMYSALEKAAVQAKNDGELSADLAQTFIHSVTEEEIECAGMLAGEGTEQKGKCLAFMRTINNIDPQHEKAKRFVDMTQPGQLDTNSQELLRKLKENLREKVSKDNIRQYTINWSDKDGVNADDHQDYLKEFSEDFFERVKKLVDLSVLERDERTRDVYDNEISHEVLAHSKQAIDKLSKVVPRTDILDKVKDYITGQSDRPLVVHGNSGCGKTSIMASVAVEARNWLASKSNNKVTAVVLRFLGTSRSSSDLEHLLKNVNAQLKTVNSRKAIEEASVSTSMTMKELISDFHDHLKKFSAVKSGTLVIILDSIDQLRKSEMAFSLSWLPKTLPQGVKFIISTLPDMYGILDYARSFDIPANNFVEVRALDESSAWGIIDKWLEMSDRKISDEQRAAVTTTFTDKQLPPLYIKLIFDILVKWTSYNTAMTIPEDVTACMGHLFSNLETTHGKLQVQLALAYLTCCPGGISEGELEDVLSIDDEFLNAVFQYHIPPVRRIPPTLWVRMKNDIRDYLVEKESFGVAALTWYHRQFIEHATQRYAGQEGLHTKHCMNTLCDYYMGKWSKEPKSFSYSQHQMEKLNLTESSAKALRYVAAQPTRYNRHEFNGRKISVLSQLWSNSVLKDQVYMNSSRYIMDIEFLTGKFVHDSWSNINEELTYFAMCMNETAPRVSSEEQMYRVEFNYIHAVMKMYNSLITMAPLSLPAQLFACLQDKYNLAVPRTPSDSTLPNLAWFLTELISGKGAQAPLLPVAKILDSPGGMQKIAGVHANLCKLFPFEFQGKSAVALLGDELVVQVFEENGTISQLMSLELSTGPEYGQLINIDGESYIFAYSSGMFCLISLNYKRVEIEESKVVVEPKNEDICICSDSMTAFLNPHFTGKDSIMFYSFENELVTVYSLKLRKVVWYHYIPEDDEETGERAEVIYYASLHDTSDSNVKTLIITFTRHTDFYQMVLLESGEVQMTKIEEKQNAFCNQKTKVYATFGVNDSKHGGQKMNVLLPEQPSNKYLVMTDKSDVKKGEWTYYRLARSCDVYMAGKLRSGEDIIAVSGFKQKSDGKHLAELYKATSSDSLRLSAVFQCDVDPYRAFLAPESDTLIMVHEKKVAFYFLSAHPDDPQLLDVRLAYEIGGGSSAPNDIVADPKGYIYATWWEGNASKLWDLTAYVNDGRDGNNPRLLTTEYCMGIITPARPANCALILQSDGHLWDVTTNQLLLHRFYENEEDDQPTAAKWLAGHGEWKHIVAILKSESLRVFGLNLPEQSSVSPADVSVKLLETHKMRSSTEASLYDKGMVAVDDSTGHMVHFYMNGPEGHAINSKYLKTTGPKAEDTTPCSWSSVGFTSLEYCYADTVFLVSGDYCDPNDDDADAISCLLIYDTSNFLLIKKIVDYSFSYAVYFKEYKKIVFVDGGTSLAVMDLNVTDLNSLAVSEISTDEYGGLTMLESYARDEQMYYTDIRSYFFVYCDKKGLLKMDVRQTAGWAEGTGVVVLGKSPDSYTDMRLSHSQEYLACTRRRIPALQLLRIGQTKLELLGELLFQGNVDKFTFTMNDQYLMLVLESGEVISVKILDCNLPGLISEANKLPCTRQRLVKSQEVMLRDERWTSMAALSGQATGGRNNNTLYNYMRNLVMPEGEPEYWKAKEPSVGSEEFEELINSLEISSEVLGTSNTYISAITTLPLDTDIVLNTDKDIEKVKLKPHPPSIPKPHPPSEYKSRPPSTKHKLAEVELSQRLNAAVGVPRLPQGLLNEIQSHAFKNSVEAEEIIPANLRLYLDLPTDEREKRLDGAFLELNKHTAVCSIQ